MEERAKFRKPKVGVRRILLHDRWVTIPKDFRNFLKLREGFVFEISVEDERLVFQLITR